MPIVVQVGSMPGEPFWDKIAVAAVGPAISVFVGSLMIAILVNKISDRKRERDLDRDVRTELVMAMSRISSTFYFSLHQYRRYSGQNSSDSKNDIIKQCLFQNLISTPINATNTLNNKFEIGQSYRTFRAEADTLETRIDVYFLNDGPREKWHAVSDLLTVRYYQTIGEINEYIIKNNAKSTEKFHSGLDETELCDETLVTKSYKFQLKEAIRAVMTSERFDFGSSLKTKTFAGPRSDT
ncbi:MAG: hypothetical protein WCL10_04640 [Novosphingobium sp.]|uniref:hypothetical protein n=1 Tax=Novosphingobium sp. TaxID=1874826 RepID=UPI003015EF90